MKKLLIVNDIGGFTPRLKSLSEIATLYSYIPRSSAISKSALETINRYCHAIVKEGVAFGEDGFEHPDWVTLTSPESFGKSEEETVADIVRVAKLFEVDAILFGGFEPIVGPVAQATEQLGFRGAGAEAAIKARSKLLMREAFRKHNVPSPAFRSIRTEEDLVAAVNELGYPLIIKPTFLACSIGVTKLDGSRDPVEVFREVYRNVMESIEEEQMLFEDECLFLVEEFMEGCSEDWYNDPTYGDYVSVEGFVIDGKCYPVAITDKTPINKQAFVESAHITPSVLDPEAQAIIFDAVIRANESLGLQFCPFHTEVKLMKGRRVGIIETAARFAGWHILPQVTEVFGIDMSRAWAEILLEGHTDLVPTTPILPDGLLQAHVRIFLDDVQDVEKNSNYVYLGHEPLDDLLEPGVSVLSEAEIIKGSIVSSVPSQNAISYLTTIDLKGKDSLSLAKTAQNIRRGIKVDLVKVEEKVKAEQTL